LRWVTTQKFQERGNNIIVPIDIRGESCHITRSAEARKRQIRYRSNGTIISLSRIIEKCRERVVVGFTYLYGGLEGVPLPMGKFFAWYFTI
jgi:hypothetical protein